ncbi:unnamed protein product [Cladocopium goreaui]|uniref:Uncharacterized protein n=1 Tax=Cladocopium goreaui TaxID=2562237 RepID=A0A9P1FU20_9DINO|nr:unnamed protein product [Cladocopium goreaui]
MSTIDELSIASGAEKLEKKPQKPSTFARWRVANGGADVDVLLHWHADLPQLPNNQEEPICTVQLCDPRGQDDGLELLEARLQQHHLARPLLAWTETQLQRLMDVMAHQSCGDAPHQDEVRLRRAPGRMVIDVHFRRPLLSAPVELGGCVVEILNAYSSGMSQSSEVLHLLRSAACAQRVHQAALAETNESLQALWRDLGRLEGDWTSAVEQAQKKHRGFLQRFALVLQAKIDKERSLHNEIQEKRWARMGAANVARLPEVAQEDALVEGKPPGAGRGRRGRGGRTGRGRGRAAARGAAAGAEDRSPSPVAKKQKVSKEAPLAVPGAASTLGGITTQGLTVPPSMSAAPATHSLFDPDSEEDEPARPAQPAQPAQLAQPAPSASATVPALPSAASKQEPAPKGPRRPSGVGVGDLFFSDSE